MPNYKVITGDVITMDVTADWREKCHSTISRVFN